MEARNGLSTLHRRRLLQRSASFGGLGLAGAGLAGCATALGVAPTASRSGEGDASAARSPYRPVLAPVRASVDRIFDITVCLRPFRAEGPRLDVETLGETRVVHNYGHGGSGWSLSWGSSTLAVQKAMADSPKDVAVVGCGALGLTSAILAQRAGARVTIYARDLLPQTRSARATGSWTPDSRIALTDKAAPGFAALWEQMARISFKTYRSYLGLPGQPVEWTDRYTVLDVPAAQARAAGRAIDTLSFAEYEHSIRDLTPEPEQLAVGASPFSAPYVYRSESMMFNIADYGHTLMNDFMTAGGKIERAEFHSPADLAGLPQKVVINCPGYGARALWRDESITPVRGQIAWLIPQPEVNYGVFYKDVSVLSRRDGIVVQALDGGDMKGYGLTDETPDRADAERGVRVMQALFANFRS